MTTGFSKPKSNTAKKPDNLPSKSDAIREAKKRLSRLPGKQDGPTAIREYLAKRGITVTAPYVSLVLSNDRRARRRRSGGIQAIGNMRVEDLKQVQGLSRRLGGYHKLRQHLDFLEKLES